MEETFKMVPIVVLFLLATAHAQIQIDSTNQKYMIKAGETVIMPCHLAASGEFDFALTPAVWIKSQEDYEEQQDGQTNAKGIIMTVGAQLAQKFNAPRFKIAYENVETGTGGSIQFNLEITGVTTKDSGTYLCQLLKNQKIVSSVVHHLYVITPIQKMWMGGYPDAGMDSSSDGQIYEDEGTDGQDKQPPRALTFFADRDGYLNCSAEGGYPAPEMWVYVDGEEIKDMQSQVYTDYYPRFVTEQDVGMQSIRVTRTQYTSRIRLDRGKSGSWIQCLAKINEKDEALDEHDKWQTDSDRSIWAKVYVEQEPLFDDKECLAEYTTSQVGQEAQITCRVHGFPFPTVTWENMETQQKYIGGEEQSRDGENNKGSSEVRAVVMHDGNKFYAKLIFPVLDEKHFAKYKLIVANGKGRKEKIIQFMTSPNADYIGGASRMSMGLGITMVLLRFAL